MIRNSLKILRNNVSVKIESAVGGAECFFNFFFIVKIYCSTIFYDYAFTSVFMSYYKNFKKKKPNEIL